MLAAPLVPPRHVVILPPGDERTDLIPAAPGAERLVNGARLVSLADGREYAVDALPFLIGSDAACDLVVEAAEVLGRHAEIVTNPSGRKVVADLSGRGILLNGVKLEGRMPLAPGDLIRVGPEELRYYPAEQPAPPAGAAARLADTLHGLPAFRRARAASPYLAPSQPSLASLLVESGERKGERLEVRTPVANIGRAEFNDLRLPDPSVGVSHASLRIHDGVWTLTDLGSTSGTRVDGEAAGEETPLPAGATIVLGEVRLLFEPRDTGEPKERATTILEFPLPEAPPPPPLNFIPASSRRRRPRARRRARGPVLAALAGLALLLLLGYLLLG